MEAAGIPTVIIAVAAFEQPTLPSQIVGAASRSDSPGSFGDLVTMLISAGLKANILTAQLHKAGICVGNYGGVSVAQVGLGINVKYRGGYIGGHFFFLGSFL